MRIPGSNIGPSETPFQRGVPTGNISDFPSLSHRPMNDRMVKDYQNLEALATKMFFNLEETDSGDGSKAQWEHNLATLVNQITEMKSALKNIDPPLTKDSELYQRMTTAIEHMEHAVAMGKEGAKSPNSVRDWRFNIALELQKGCDILHGIMPNFKPELPSDMSKQINDFAWQQLDANLDNKDGKKWEEMIMHVEDMKRTLSDALMDDKLDNNKKDQIRNAIKNLDSALERYQRGPKDSHDLRNAIVLDLTAASDALKNL